MGSRSCTSNDMRGGDAVAMDHGRLDQMAAGRSAMTHGVFVTGTDTGVGKTAVATALLRALVRDGRRAVGMKPVATGLAPDAALNADVGALIAAGNVAASPGEVNPFAFAPPIAPHLAAAAVGGRIDLDRIAAAYAGLARIADAVVVEGAGGVFVPLGPGIDMLDIPRRLGLPVLLVVAIRLGCLNHALLSALAIECARRSPRGVGCKPDRPAGAGGRRERARTRRAPACPAGGRLRVARAQRRNDGVFPRGPCVAGTCPMTRRLISCGLRVGATGAREDVRCGAGQRCLPPFPRALIRAKISRPLQQSGIARVTGGPLGRSCEAGAMRRMPRPARVWRMACGAGHSPFASVGTRTARRGNTGACGNGAGGEAGNGVRHRKERWRVWRTRSRHGA